MHQFMCLQKDALEDIILLMTEVVVIERKLDKTG